MGPATRPCRMRKKMSASSVGAKPHSQDVKTNSSTLQVNSRTAPTRCVSQPVKGTEMALATPKLVMIQVPWLGLAPRLPAMAGSDTLAIDVSSTFMKVASERASVPRMSCMPDRGCGLAVDDMVRHSVVARVRTLGIAASAKQRMTANTTLTDRQKSTRGGPRGRLFESGNCSLLADALNARARATKL